MRSWRLRPRRKNIVFLCVLLPTVFAHAPAAWLCMWHVLACLLISSDSTPITRWLDLWPRRGDRAPSTEVHLGERLIAFFWNTAYLNHHQSTTSGIAKEFWHDMDSSKPLSSSVCYFTGNVPNELYHATNYSLARAAKLCQTCKGIFSLHVAGT